MRIRRVLSLVLTGLILFGISVPSKAKSETKPMNIKSILNMTEEQSEKTTRLKDIMIAYINKEDKNIYDLITGKFIMNNSKIDTKYLTSIGINSKELSRYNINEYITLYNIFLSNHGENFYGLYEMGSKLQTAKTIGDVLEIYSYLGSAEKRKFFC